MSLQQIRRNINGLKESSKIRPLSMLLQCEAGSLTDEELNRVITEVSPFILPVDFLIESIERQNRDYFNLPDNDFGFSSIDDIPKEYIEKMKENFKNGPAAIEKRSKRD